MYLTRQVKNEYDVIVVGAGPSGSTAAWQAARNGMKVLLLERDKEVGTPVRCAEGVSKRALEEIIEQPAPVHWIAAEIHHFRLIAPDGTPVYVNMNETGFVLHRQLFDYDLAFKAVRAGATLITTANVFDVLGTDGTVNGVCVEIDGGKKQIKSKLVIAADGVESRVARWAGINSTIKERDLETCVQYTLAGVDINPDTCDFYFSREFAPGGYAWVFPKGDGTANVGLGVAGNYARNKSPNDYFQAYLERCHPTASVISQTVGGVPADKTLKEIVSDGFMVVGDAAHQANPISGGGIISGMIAGKIAGEVAARAVKDKNLSKKALLPYMKQWHKRVGKNHQLTYRLKEALVKFDDERFNIIAAEFLKLDKDQRSLFNLFKIAFKSKPSFLINIFNPFASP